MRKWKVLVAVIAVACVVPTTFAQTQEDVLQELKNLKDRVSSLETENAELRGSVTTQNDSELELQINALTDRLVAGTTVKSAANPVTLTGEFRFRNSWSFGDRFAGANAGNDDEHDGSWNDALLRLGFQYEFTRDVTAFAELQSRWAFGNGVSTSGNLAAENGTTTPVRMHQAWLEIRNIFGRAEFSSRTGRQEIVLGNQFQFGNADWFSGWSFDGTRWDWDSENFSLTGIVAKLRSADGDFNQFSSFATPHDDDELYSVYFTLKTIKNHELDLYWIYVNGHGGAADFGSGISVGSLPTLVGSNAGGQTSYYHTLGARIGGVFPDIAAGLDWNVEGAYQLGDQNAAGAGELDIDAFAIEAEIGITFNKDSMFRVYIRFLWAEGPENNELGYRPLYPNRHSNSGFRARYGQFDLIPMTNVLTIQGGLHFDPAENWTLGATFLYAEQDNNTVATNDEELGIEVDIWAEYRYSEHLVFNVGVALLFPEDAGEALWLVDEDLQFLGYIQARLLF